MRDAGAQVRPDHATARRSEGDAPSRCLGNGRKRSISAAPLQNTRQTDLVGSLGLKSDRLLGSAVAAYAFYAHWFISVWCFFAAAMSIVVALHLIAARGETSALVENAR